MNIRKPRGALTPRGCRDLHHAWIEANRRGRPLNRMITVKPLGGLSPLGHAKLDDWTWNLGGWSRYHGDGFFCLLVRERQSGSQEHFHVLIQIGTTRLARGSGAMLA